MLSLLFTQLIFHTEVKRDGGAKDYSPWEQATEWKIYQKLASQYHQHINNILHMCMAAFHMCSKATIPIATQKDFSYMNIY